MNRLIALVLSLVVTASHASTINDKVKTFRVYTGPNTTPTLEVATSGAVTLGESGNTDQHTLRGPVSITGALSLTTLLSLASGGTNKGMTAVNGGIVWTDSDSQEVTAAGTSGQHLVSAGAAAPAWTGLTNGQIWIGNGSNIPVAVTPSGDVTMTNAGVNAIASGVIVDDDVNASAAIAGSKLQAAGASNAGAVTTGTQTFAGAKSFSTSISVNSATNATVLIDSLDTTRTWSDGAGWTSGTTTVHATRVNDMVFLTISALGNAASSSSNDINGSSVLPAGWRPSSTVGKHLTIYDNSSYVDGVFTITSGGTMSFKKGSSGGNNAWTNTNNKGVIRTVNFNYTTD